MRGQYCGQVTNERRVLLSITWPAHTKGNTHSRPVAGPSATRHLHKQTCKRCLFKSHKTSACLQTLVVQHLVSAVSPQLLVWEQRGVLSRLQVQLLQPSCHVLPGLHAPPAPGHVAGHSPYWPWGHTEFI